MRLFTSASIAIAVAGLLAGCSDDHPHLAPVSGTAVYQGQLIAHGTIIFQVPGSRPATGKIIDGRISEVTTFDPGDGAPVGQARIALFANADSLWKPPANPPKSPAEWTPESSPPMVIKSLIPARYNDPITSELTCEIKPGMVPLQIELKP